MLFGGNNSQQQGDASQNSGSQSGSVAGATGGTAGRPVFVVAEGHPESAAFAKVMAYGAACAVGTDRRVHDSAVAQPLEGVADERHLGHGDEGTGQEALERSTLSSL